MKFRLKCRRSAGSPTRRRWWGDLTELSFARVGLAITVPLGSQAVPRLGETIDFVITKESGPAAACGISVGTGRLTGPLLTWRWHGRVGGQWAANHRTHRVTPRQIELDQLPRPCLGLLSLNTWRLIAGDRRALPLVA